MCVHLFENITNFFLVPLTHPHRKITVTALKTHHWQLKIKQVVEYLLCNVKNLQLCRNISHQKVLRIPHINNLKIQLLHHLQTALNSV